MQRRDGGVHHQGFPVDQDAIVRQIAVSVGRQVAGEGRFAAASGGEKRHRPSLPCHRRTVQGQHAPVVRGVLKQLPVDVHQGALRVVGLPAIGDGVVTAGAAQGRIIGRPVSLPRVLPVLNGQLGGKLTAVGFDRDLVLKRPSEFYGNHRSALSSQTS